MVFPDKHPRDKDHICLREIKGALEDGRLCGFICETVGTLEAINKKKRADYFANRTPKSDIRTETIGNNTNLTITFRTDHSLHCGLDPRLMENLQEAQRIGMRSLPAPRLNLPAPSRFLNDPTFYEPQAFTSEAYDRFGNASADIEARGAGAAAIAAVVRRIEQRSPANAQVPKPGSQLLLHAKDDAERAEINKAVAEWADGDLVAAHIACKNDLLCTRDEGKSARSPSVFDAINRAWLKADYGVEFVTIPELASRL